MADPNVTKPPSLPAKQSGVKTVLSYTGIPPSWLDKRPKLPSRNWLIFLSVTSSIVGLYVYDRQECKKIRQTYVDKVKHLAEATADPFDTPRKVTVYGAKWPADEEYMQGIKYFRKYVKPILVAAAVDYEMIHGKRHGDIAARVAEDTRLQRRLALGLDVDPEARKMLPTYRPVAARAQHALGGGVVLIGRPTFKEYMAGVCKGWTAGLEPVDADDALARVLENDAHFDEPADPADMADADADADAPAGSLRQAPLSPHASPVFSPLQMQSKPTHSQLHTSNTPPTPSAPPSVIPPLPPLLLVPFTNYIGITQIPLMIWGFFNQRHKVHSGAEAGYRLVMGNTRPVNIPEDTVDFVPSSAMSEPAPPVDLGDLDFDKEAEGFYKKSLDKFSEDTDKVRQKYYEALPKKLATARELARGTRESTKEEYENPPPTEVELRAERLKKERRWRDDVHGWDIVKPSAAVQWDERLRGSLTVFVDPEQDQSDHPPPMTS